MLLSRPDLPLNEIAIKYVLSLKYRSTSAYLMDNLLNWMRIRFQQIENDRSNPRFLASLSLAQDIF